MDNDNFSFLADAESSITGDKTEGYTPKEQELIHQLVQERLGKKNAIEFESLDDYVVPPKMFFSMIKKPAVSIRANRMEFSMSAIRLFEGVQHVLPMLSENKKRMVVAICAEEEISSIEWARLKKDKWVNRSISCPEYVQSIYKMMNWNKECRYKIYGRLANSERGLVLVFDLASAVMFDPLPEEYFDKHTGKMKKRIVKYYPDEIRMKLGRSYSERFSNEVASNHYPDTWIPAVALFPLRFLKSWLLPSVCRSRRRNGRLCLARLLEMEATMMSETTNEDRMYPIEMTLQGARCCISIGKGVIKALGKPSHVSIKISDNHDSLSVFPCDEDDVMAFRVPLKLFTDHRCVMRINSKQFVHGIMRTNQMDTSKTYVLSGEFLEEKNTAVFSLVEGVSLRTQKGMAQS